jgi:hypothetical protein
MRRPTKQVAHDLPVELVEQLDARADRDLPSLQAWRNTTAPSSYKLVLLLGVEVGQADQDKPGVTFTAHCTAEKTASPVEPNLRNTQRGHHRAEFLSAQPKARPCCHVFLNGRQRAEFGNT